jgi:hypothetical protein
VKRRWKRARPLATSGLCVALIGSAAAAAERTQVDENNVYTLYRSSAVIDGDKWRLHVATFDSTDGAEYNRDNCHVAVELFQAQPGVKVTYWCERGFFSKK